MNKKGFTLIELMIVITILLIILSIVIPRFIYFKENSDVENRIVIEEPVSNSSDDFSNNSNRY